MIQAIPYHAQGHTYLVIASEAHRGQAVRQLGRWAANPQLPFTWHDAAILGHIIQRQENQPCESK